MFIGGDIGFRSANAKELISESVLSRDVINDWPIWEGDANEGKIIGADWTEFVLHQPFPDDRERYGPGSVQPTKSYGLKVTLVRPSIDRIIHLTSGVARSADTNAPFFQPDLNVDQTVEFNKFLASSLPYDTVSLGDVENQAHNDLYHQEKADVKQTQSNQRQ